MSPKTKRILFILAPLVLGGGVILYLNRKKKTPVNDRTDAGDTDSKQLQQTLTSSANLFPLKKGSRGDLVAALQNALIAAYGKALLPKYGADADWGTETDTAVQSKLGITQIADKTQFNSIITSLKTSAAAQQITSAAISKAQQIFNNWTNNAALKLIVTAPLSAAVVTIDYNKTASSTGKFENVAANTPLPREHYQPYLVLSNGNLVVKHITTYWIGDPDVTYLVFRPDTTTLI